MLKDFQIRKIEEFVDLNVKKIIEEWEENPEYKSEDFSWNEFPKFCFRLIRIKYYIKFPEFEGKIHKDTIDFLKSLVLKKASDLIEERGLKDEWIC